MTLTLTVLTTCVNSGECAPQYGMTPLMHAAYKGKADMCRLLLQHGADVNCNEHEHGYTALMFAGLSGKRREDETLFIPEGK